MDDVNAIIAKVFSVSAEDINDGMSPETVSAWDSMNHLVLISEIEKRFNIEFSVDEVIHAGTVGDIKASIRRKGVAV